MFVSIGVHGTDRLNTIFNAQGWENRFLLPLWGLGWIFAFVIFQSVILRRISNYLRERGIRAFFDALKSLSEMVKLALALLFGFGYIRFLLGYYPFPSKPISFWMSIAFGAFSWGVSAFIVWLIKKADVVETQENQIGTVGTIFGFLLGFLIGAAFLVAGYYFPGLFYFHGMLGLFCLTMLACQLLFRSDRKKGMSNKFSEATPDSVPQV